MRKKNSLYWAYSFFYMSSEIPVELHQFRQVHTPYWKKKFSEYPLIMLGQKKTCTNNNIHHQNLRPALKHFSPSVLVSGKEKPDSFLVWQRIYLTSLYQFYPISCLFMIEMTHYIPKHYIIKRPRCFSFFKNSSPFFSEASTIMPAHHEYQQTKTIY